MTPSWIPFTRHWPFVWFFAITTAALASAVGPFISQGRMLWPTLCLFQKGGANRNGIQLVSKCLLHQGLTQCPTWFCHEGESFGPPLFDPGLDAVRTHGIDEQDLQRHPGVRGSEPPQRV